MRFLICFLYNKSEIFSKVLLKIHLMYLSDESLFLFFDFIFNNVENP